MFNVGLFHFSPFNLYVFPYFLCEISHIFNSFYSCPPVLSFLPLFLLVNFSVDYGYFPMEGKVGEKHQILFLEMLNV